MSNTLTDRTSIVAFIENNWVGGQRAGTTSLDDVAGSLNDTFDFAHPGFTPLLLNPATGQPVN